MNPPRVLRLSLAALLVAELIAFGSGCNKSTGTPPPATPASGSAPTSDIDPVYGNLTHAQPKLPTVKIWLGDQILNTEIAHTPVQIATGMMFRTNTPEDQAMIFVFPDAREREFYMRNCFVSLSGAYISPDGEILQIIQMQAQNTNTIASESPNVQFVLETAPGWFDHHHITTGAVLRTEHGSLTDTFFPRSRQ